MTKISLEKALSKANSHQKKSEFAEAEMLYRAVLKAFPSNKRAKQGLAVVQRQQLNAAKQHLISDHLNQLTYLYKEGRLNEVIMHATQLTVRYPNNSTIWNILGVAAAQTELIPTALDAFQKVIDLEPNNAAAYNNMGNILRSQGNLALAMTHYQKALTSKPNYAEAFYNIGILFDDQGDREKALSCYQKALTLKPNYPDAYNNLGNVFRDKGNHDEAIASYQEAISLNPHFLAAYNNMGVAFEEQGELNEAIKAYKEALSLNTNYTEARVHYLHLLSHVCDWRSIQDDSELIPALGTVDKFVSPFAMLSLEDAPERHRQRSELFSKAKFAHASQDYSPKADVKSRRLRVGYFSADFHNHATMFLLARVFEAHNKDKFEIFIYSYGPDQQDDMRQRLKDAVDHFYDVKDMSDEQITNLARENNLDIAVDLKGFTQHNRLGPFSHRLAPVQISYLGYPGTLGTNFIDYIVADEIVIPSDKRQFYSEQIIYLPNSYQPTDNKRVISNKMFARSDVGLPDNGFVFCCFNNTYKITPIEFDIWMRLLHQVDGSVLWLLKSNKWAEQNLRQEAKIRGIDEKRLIFAERAPQAEHLARQRLADLFLDTFNVNAHTTTSDALWAGLPVITKPGEGFAARVAASLLNAIGLPELVTKTTEQYEALALELAQNPSRLKHLKNTLSQNRLTHPLFNSVMYTEHLERGYKMAFENYSNGHKPATIIVPE